MQRSSDFKTAHTQYNGDLVQDELTSFSTACPLPHLPQIINEEQSMHKVMRKCDGVMSCITTVSTEINNPQSNKCTTKKKKKKKRKEPGGGRGDV